MSVSLFSKKGHWSGSRGGNGATVGSSALEWVSSWLLGLSSAAPRACSLRWCVDTPQRVAGRGGACGHGGPDSWWGFLCEG